MMTLNSKCTPTIMKIICIYHSLKIVYLVFFMCFFVHNFAFAQSIKGAGSVSGIGINGHFIIGMFDDENNCINNIKKIFLYFSNQSGWISESLNYNIHGCFDKFSDKTIYYNLHNFKNIKNVVLFHPNIRIAFISNRGHDYEMKICNMIAPYIQEFFNGRVICILQDN